MHVFKKTSLVLSSLGVLSAALVLGSPLSANAALSKPTAASLIAAANAAIKKENGVHVDVTTVAGKITTVIDAKIGLDNGTETYSSGSENFKITVTPTYAYLSGSKTGLTNVMGLSAAEQKKVGKLSISMKKGSEAYKTFHTNLTSGVLTELIPPSKGTTLLAARDKKTNGYQLTWKEPATATEGKTTSVMTLSSGAKTLPIRVLVTTAGGESQTKYSKWNDKVSVTVPTKTIPYSKIFPK
jgi:hypothetical protein